MPKRKNIDRARTLRTDQTDVEQLLWQKLRRRQLDNMKFRRQHPIGNFIVDFVCLEEKLIIELDGSQHFSAVIYDKTRTLSFELHGYKVLRFWNNDVIDNLEGVLTDILSHLGTPHPSLLPRREKE